MARQKISEFRAKSMLLANLDSGHSNFKGYAGITIDSSKPLAEQLAQITDTTRYVVKVDQAIKKRMKQGLVKLDRSAGNLETDIQEFADKGFRYCLVEPMFVHDATAEHYLAFSNDRTGTNVTWSTQGGIDIEDAASSIQTGRANSETFKQVTADLSLPDSFVENLCQTFDAAYGCFLEINPLVSNSDSPQLLDVAAEVDSEASYLTREYWTADDVRSYRQQTAEELAISELAAQSRASLRYEVINPDGAVWVLLSGGGASVTVADEVNNRGYGSALANYGEYSGNPSEPETYSYTTQLLKSLLQSKAPRKTLIIAGGIANFSDVRSTFTGVIRALDANIVALNEQAVKVYVRRGGPHEIEGLELMRNYLAAHNLLGEVHGPALPLADSVTAALAELELSA